MQINRLFEIIYILLDKKRVTAQELAEHFEVSTRTIYRDIEILSGTGVPVYMSKGKGGGVSLLPEFVLNKTIITEKEKEEILSSLKAMGTVRFGEEVTALRKLESLFGRFGDSNTDWIEVDFGAWSDGKREEDFFQTLKKAIIRKRVIRFSYASVKGQMTRRDVEPLRLCFKSGAWYLYGYCREQKDYRFFKLKRIRGLEITEEIFQRVYTEQVLGEQQHVYQKKMVDLKLKIEREAAYRVYDEFETYEQLEDGSFLVEIKFPYEEWLLYYIFSFGRNVEVIEPVEIRNRVQVELNKMLEKYS